MATENNDLNVSEVFLRFSQGNLRASLKRVKTVKTFKNERIRTQALYALKIGLSLGQDVWPETVRLLVEMSPKMNQGGYWDEWIRYLEQGIQLSQFLIDDNIEAELKLELGLLYKHRGEYDKAQNYFSYCVEIFEKLDYRNKQSIALYRLAHVTCLEGRYEDAAHLGEQALTLATDNDRERANCYSILGTIAYEQWDWKSTKNYFSIALQLYEQSGDTKEIARSFQNLGATLQMQERFDEAIKYHQKASSLFKEIYDPINLATSQMNLGIIYSQLKQPLKALKLYESAELIFQEVQANLRLAQTYTNKAKQYYEIQKWEQAEYTCLKAIEYWYKLKDIWNLANAMDELGLIYISTNQYSNAVESFQSGLNKLQEIPEHSRYSSLYELLEQHLKEAKDKLNHY